MQTPFYLQIFNLIFIFLNSFCRIFQAPQSADGQTYIYNITICSAIPYPCAGACSSPDTSAVCQLWGSPPSAKCVGQLDRTTTVEGLSMGVETLMNIINLK